jgi:hypothetical protein
VTRMQDKNHNINKTDVSFENLVKCKYLGMTVKSQNYIREESKRKQTWRMRARIPYGMFCHFVSPKFVKRIYMRMLPVVFYGCEIWFLKLKNTD